MFAAAHPITRIWLHPRETILRITGHDPEYRVLPLTFLAGTSVASLALMGGAGKDGVEPGRAIGTLLIGGPLWGLVNLYVGGWLLALFGSGLGGRASPLDIRAAIAWSNVPVVFGAAFAWSAVALMPRLGDNVAPAVFMAFLGWGYVTLALSLAAVQRFSPFRAAGSMAGVALLVAGGELLSGFGIDWLMREGVSAVSAGAG